jgi:cytochrome b561
MTSFYLGLALILALSINSRLAVVRVLAVAMAAVALGFMAWSIVLANLDGTFARAPAGSALPWLLNGEAVLIALAALFLLVTIPRQWRSDGGSVPVRSTTGGYGHITRGLHWGSATLIIAAFTMGQFIAVLAPGNPVRGEFVATHMAVGGAIFLLTFARMFERLVRPAPPNKAEAHIGHFLLYTLLTAICVTGLALAPAPIDLMGLKLPNLPAGAVAGPLHKALPVLLGLLFLGHVFAARRSIRRTAS